MENKNKRESDGVEDYRGKLVLWGALGRITKREDGSMATDPCSEPICSLLSIRWKMSGWPFVRVSVSCVALVIYFVFLILSVVSQSIGVFMVKELTFCLPWITVDTLGLFGFLFQKKNDFVML